MPSYASKDIPGLFVYRNIADMDSLLTYSEKDGIKGGKVGQGRKQLAPSLMLIV